MELVKTLPFLAPNRNHSREHDVLTVFQPVLYTSLHRYGYGSAGDRRLM